MVSCAGKQAKQAETVEVEATEVVETPACCEEPAACEKPIAAQRPGETPAELRLLLKLPSNFPFRNLREYPQRILFFYASSPAERYFL